MTNIEYAEGLERIAAIYRAHPKLPTIFQGTLTPLTIYVHDTATLAATIMAFGSGDKKDGGNSINFHPHVTKPVDLEICVFKDGICKRIVIGKKVIPAAEEIVIPARAAHEEIIYGWECSPLTKRLEE